MSAQLPEPMREAFDALLNKDRDRFVACFDTEAELVPMVSELEGTVYKGHDGILRWWENLIAVFPEFDSEVDDVRDLGGHIILTIARFRGDEDSSEVTMWTLVELRDGKIAGWRSFSNESAALAAAA
jgi:ketosteroid isomerase-like protein